MDRPQPRISSKQTGIAARGIFYLLIVMGCVGLISWFLSGESKAPILVSPDDSERVRGQVGAETPLTIEWRHGGITSDRRLPSRAHRFVVCFYDPNEAQACGGDDADVLFVSEDTTAISRTRLELSGLFYSVLDYLAPLYDYTYEISLPVNALDRLLTWTVGACSGGAQLETCALATPERQLGVATHNLVAVEIDADRFGADVVFEVLLRSEGETTSDPYEVSVIVWEIMQDDNRQPLLDPLDQDVEADDIAITTAGDEVSITLFRHGTLPLDQLLAIWRPGSPRYVWSHEFPMVPNPNNPNPTCVQPCSSTACFDGVVPRDCRATPSQSSALFAAFYRLDPDDLVVEFNENDNMIGVNTIRSR